MDDEIEVKVARTHDDAILPTKGSVHAAGWDLYSLQDTIVNRRIATMVRTGLHVAIPEGYEGQVRARSSLGKKGLILPHSIGTIDADYRGEIKVILINLGKKKFVVEKGSRIAQMVLCPIAKAKIREVENLEKTDRGSGGFGSTGTK